MRNIFEIATVYAFKCHTETNHLYDGKPYSFHLDMVDEVIMKFKHLVPADKLIIYRAGGRCHDLIEDCRQTYNDVRTSTNSEVADLAYALSNEKGKSRSERANDKYYEGIIAQEGATFIKLADRIANIRYSKTKKSHMIGTYRAESSSFYDKMQLDKFPEYKEMIIFMNELLSSES